MRFSALMAVAAIFLAGCDSNYSDNVDGSTYPDQGIDTSTISDEAHMPAGLTLGAGLDYQAALIYEVALNMRGYDAVDTTPIEEASVEDCDIRGHLLEEFFQDDPDSPYVDGPLPISHSEAVFCGRPLESDPDVAYFADGQLYFTETETDDCDAAPCPVAYGHYGGFLYPYQLLYQDPAGEPDRTRSRVEIDGTYHDGPGESVPGSVVPVQLPVEERTQRLTVVNSVETLVGDAVTDKTVFGLIYGESGERFVRRDVPDTDELFLDGALASGSDAAAECVGGELTVATPSSSRLALDGAGNITAGEVELDNGDGDTATLTFEANGDVSVTDSASATDTFTRGEIEMLRDTCFQTVPVRR
jgi:hypothetical protein